MTTPDVTHRRVADEVALALVTVAVVVGFSRLFDRATFYPPLLGVALLAHLAAALTRRSRNVLAGPIMLVVGFVATIDLTAWSTTTSGVPTPSTLRAAGHELRQSWHALSTVVAPTAPTTGFLLAAAIAIWVASWAADRLAFRFAAPVEALAHVLDDRFGGARVGTAGLTPHGGAVRSAGAHGSVAGVRLAADAGHADDRQSGEPAFEFRMDF